MSDLERSLTGQCRTVNATFDCWVYKDECSLSEKQTLRLSNFDVLIMLKMTNHHSYCKQMIHKQNIRVNLFIQRINHNFKSRQTVTHCHASLTRWQQWKQFRHYSPNSRSAVLKRCWAFARRSIIKEHLQQASLHVELFIIFICFRYCT